MIEIDKDVMVETAYQGSNNSVVRTSEGLVLIDLPYRPSDAVEWRERIRPLGEPVFLINTDHHPDHSLGDAFVPGTLVAHEGTRRALQAYWAPGGRCSRVYELMEILDPAGKELYLKDYVPRFPSVTFADRMSLHLGGVDIDLIHTPGHTFNTIAVHLPQQGIVFVGDTICCDVGIPSFAEGHVYTWLDSLDRIEALAPRLVVTGHGDVCGVEMIAPFRDEMRGLVAQVEQRIARGEERDQVSREIIPRDLIHVGGNGWTPFPEKYVTEITIRSIAKLYDDVAAARAAA